MAKVSWPSKDDLRTYTIVVIVSTFVICVLMGVWDKLLSKAVEIGFKMLGG
ncbi:preprotein translocase subunit SecE [bacterium]|nr:preprotein translocase subunit SecE [bacterium]